VTWPTRENRDDDAVPIGGRVDPRSSVHVNGVIAEPDRNGRFAASVPVHDGANPVVVEVEDISGRVKFEKHEVRKVPTRPPDLEPIKTELWNTK
jgi:Glucodextranase, domain B